MKFSTFHIWVNGTFRGEPIRDILRSTIHHHVQQNTNLTSDPTSHYTLHDSGFHKEAKAIQGPHHHHWQTDLQLPLASYHAGCCKFLLYYLDGTVLSQVTSWVSWANTHWRLLKPSTTLSISLPLQGDTHPLVPPRTRNSPSSSARFWILPG